MRNPTAVCFYQDVDINQFYQNQLHSKMSNLPMFTFHSFVKSNHGLWSDRASYLKFPLIILRRCPSSCKETFSALLALCEGNPPVTGVDSPHKGQWRGAMVSSLICAWTDGWANTREARDLRRHGPHYDVTVMLKPSPRIGFINSNLV